MTRQSATVITNFGGNVQFRPKYFYAPRSEAELLDILDRHGTGTIRVFGAKHSWNPGLASDDVSVDLRHFNRVETTTDDEGRTWATVGGGCPLKVLLRKLRVQADVTLPTLGLITEQTIGGAISTGTHGSGRHSISHYMEEIRVAAYDPDTGNAVIRSYTEGPELRAARCAIGCLGIIVSVRFRCIRRYVIAERMGPRADLNEILDRVEEFPLQQFYFIPHLWGWYTQERRVPDGPAGRRRSPWAPLYRWYWLAWLDVSFHLLLKTLTSVFRRGAVITFYRTLFPKLIPAIGPVEDWSEDQLVMEHELFRHVEIELFVTQSRLREAVKYIREVLEVFADTTEAISTELGEQLDNVGWRSALEESRGSFTHHYPICFRLVLPDDTMLSMASGTGEPYYSISFISYTLPLEPFEGLATFLAGSMAALFDARPHWGKYFPLSGDTVQKLYPELDAFRDLCLGVDPDGVFRNPFVDRALGFARATATRSTGDSVS